MKYVMCLALVVLGGCGFAEGFRDKSLRELPSLAVPALESVIDSKLSEKNSELKDGLKEAIKGLADQIPKPKEQENNTLGYSLGVLAALILANAAKGGIRMAVDKLGNKDAS